MFSRELAVACRTMISRLSPGTTRPSTMATAPIEISASLVTSMPLVSTSTTTQRWWSDPRMPRRSQSNSAIRTLLRIPVAGGNVAWGAGPGPLRGPLSWREALPGKVQFEALLHLARLPECLVDDAAIECRKLAEGDLVRVVSRGSVGLRTSMLRAQAHQLEVFE